MDLSSMKFEPDEETKRKKRALDTLVDVMGFGKTASDIKDTEHMKQDYVPKKVDKKGNLVPCPECGK